MLDVDMLSEEVKADIQASYSRILSEKGFKSRFCQKVMIADIANMLGSAEEVEDSEVKDSEVGSERTDSNICVIEAGTGTGKTIAYIMACLPLARLKDKKLVISTATVALQEQIVFKDLPDIQKLLPDLKVEFSIAKGRRRYVCLAQLDRVLQEGDAFNYSLDLYDDEVLQMNIDADNRETCASMLDLIGRGRWDGDRDRWATEVDDAVWNKISMDHTRCSGRSCSFYDNCSFYKAREGVYRADCIVANHDLVLSDLMMGGGVVLPAPEDTIYVFDEGHHLPEKAVNHLSHFTRLQSSQSWLEKIPQSLERLVNEVGDLDHLLGNLPADEELVLRLVQMTTSVSEYLQAYDSQAEKKFGRQVRQYRFASGDCSQPLREMAAILFEDFQKLFSRLDMIEDELQKRMSDEDLSEQDVELKSQYETWYPLIASFSARADASRQLWRDYMLEDKNSRPPKARWLNFNEELNGVDIQVNSSPVSIGEDLRDLLWDRAFAAIVTSATLSVGGDFSLFALKAGIHQTAGFRVLPSPFNYSEQGVLNIPDIKADPRNPDEHSAAVAELLPEMLENTLGSLVLFTSWRQMQQVEDLLPGDFAERLLVQGNETKAEIIRRHKESIEAGEFSVIFGLASFAEGIDLPGKLCEHVVVVKIPFAVPDDPVGATYNEWLESQGRNAFVEISIPDAILKLTQACGRLIRTEEDTGIVSILDRRLVTQRYGSRILSALPPFRRG